MSIVSSSKYAKIFKYFIVKVPDSPGDIRLYGDVMRFEDMHDILHIAQGAAILDESTNLYYNKTGNDQPQNT